MSKSKKSFLQLKKKKRLQRLLASFLAISTLFFIGFGDHSFQNESVSATSVTVCKPTGCDYTEIQAAIDYVASEGGGTVDVKAGTYLERLTLQSGVDVIGEAAGTTILSGPSVGPSGEKVAGASNMTFSNMTVNGGTYGIYNSGVSPKIDNCIVTGASQDGIYNTGSVNPEISNTAINGNGNYGITNLSSAEPVIRESVINGNGSHGIANLGAGANIKIYNNEIYSNGANGINHDTSNGLIYENEIYTNNSNGIFVKDSAVYLFKNEINGPSQNVGVLVDAGTPRIINNKIGSRFSANSAAGIQVSNNPSTSIEIIDNELSGNGKNINFAVAGSTATIIGNTVEYSDTTNIDLNNGTYVIMDNTISFSKSVAGPVQGHGISISGSLVTADIQYNVLSENGVIGGRAINDASCSGTTIKYNLIVDNKGDGYFTSAAACSSSSIENNIFDSNGGDAIYTGGVASLTIKHNQITNNSGDGLGSTGAPTGNEYNNLYNNTGGNFNGWTKDATDLEYNPFYMKDNVPKLSPYYALQSYYEGYGDNTSPVIDKGEPTPAHEDKYRPPGRGGVRGDIGAYGGTIPKPAVKVEGVKIDGQDVTDGASVSVATATPKITGLTGQDLLDAGNEVRVYWGNQKVGYDLDLDFNCTEIDCANDNGKRSNFDITTSDLGLNGSYILNIVVVNKLDLATEPFQVTVNLSRSAAPSTINSFVKTLLPTYNTASIEIPYEVIAGSAGFKQLELYYRKGNIGTFVKYNGEFTSSPITFDSAQAGGDGLYQFYTIAEDNSGNKEAAPTGYDAYTNILSGDGGQTTTGQITNLGISDYSIKSSSVELTFTAPGDSAGEKVADYDIRYTHSYLTDKTWDQATRVKYNLDPADPGSLEKLTILVNASGTAGSKSDVDEDGLTDYMETILWGTSAVNQDTDGDGFHDGTETYHKYSPLFPYPYKPDQDHDGLNDDWEIRHGLNEKKADTDGDGYNDKVELDSKYDPRNINPRSNLFDLDHDRLTDYEERYVFRTNPGHGDSDNDGYDDYTEVHTMYDPVKMYYFGIRSVDVAGNESPISNRVWRYVY